MLMQELYDDFLISHNMFSLYLSDITDTGNRSKLWFGGYDIEFIRQFNGFSGYSDTQIEGLINWIPLAKGSRYWEVKLSKFTYTHSYSQEQTIYSYGSQLNRGCTAIIDSGSSYNIIDANNYASLTNAIR